MGLKERYTVLVILVFVSYALGWYMRGDVIFGAMYDRDIHNVGTLLPVKGEK